jgi:hypothetical protein
MFGGQISANWNEAMVYLNLTFQIGAIWSL